MKRSYSAEDSSESDDDSLLPVDGKIPKTNEILYIFKENENEFSRPRENCRSTNREREVRYMNNIFRFYVSPGGLSTNATWYKEILEIFNSEETGRYNYQEESLSSPSNRFIEYVCLNVNPTVSNEIEDFNEGQKEVYRRVMKFYHENAASSSSSAEKNGLKKFFKIFGVIGQTGTGESTSAKQFLSHYPTVEDGISKTFTYLAVHNSTIADTRKSLEFRRRNSFVSYTLCSFVMKLLSCSFDLYQDLRYFLKTKQVTDYNLFFDSLDINEEFFESLWTGMAVSPKCFPEVSPESYAQICTICLDGFSLVDYSLFEFLYKLLEFLFQEMNFPDDTEKKSSTRCMVLLLCGDCYQIQPIDAETSNYPTCSLDLSSSSGNYDENCLSQNSKTLLNCMYEKVILTKQMRNSDEDYMMKLIAMCESNDWINFIKEEFSEELLENKTIPFEYDLRKLFENDFYFDVITKARKCIADKKVICKNKDIFTRGLSKIFEDNFKSFNYLSFCNVGAHFINLSVFKSTYKQTEKFSVACDKNAAMFKIKEKKNLFKSCFPQLAPIRFVVHEKLHKGRYHHTRIPLLPLIVGLKYKFLLNQKDVGLISNQELYLVYFNQNYILLLDDHDTLYKCTPTTFYMRLFNNYWNSIFEPIPGEDYSDGEHREEKVWGYPILLSCGSTIHQCMGRTIEEDVYINLAGCNKNLAYVSLSRCEEDRIKAVAL